MKKFLAVVLLFAVAGGSAAFAQYAGRHDGDYIAPTIVKKVDDVESLNKYIASHPERLKSVDCVGMNALHYAAGAGNLKSVILLIEKGLDVNSTSKYGDLPIYRAAKEGHFEVVEYLLSKGSKLDATLTFGDKKVSMYDAMLNKCKKEIDQYSYQKVYKILVLAKKNNNNKKEEAVRVLNSNEVKEYKNIIDESMIMLRSR